MKTGANCTHRTIHNVGDFLMTQTVDFEQSDHSTMLDRQLLECLVRLTLPNVDVVSEGGELDLQALELCATVGAPLDEDVLVESWFDLEREPRRAVQQLLGCRLGEVGEQQRLVRCARRALAGCAGPRAGERVDVRLPERLSGGRLVLQRLGVGGQVLLEDVELRLSPVAAEPVRGAL